MNPLISVIIPVYNAEKYIKKCLDSLVNQTIYDIEIICVNDGSTDSSLSVVEEYANRDKRIVVINQENMGVSVARNTGLEFVHGQYYMFVDSDDWIDFGTCSELYLLAKKNDADCVMCAYMKEFSDHSVMSPIFERDLIIWTEDEVRKKFHRRLFGPIGEELTHPEFGDILISPCMQLFKTEKFVNIRFYDIRDIGTFEDGLYQIDVYGNCNKFVYINKPFYHYRKTNDSSITTAYKSKLVSLWKKLFSIMESIVEKEQFDEYYFEALDNRVCLSMIGLGLNQIRSGQGVVSDAREIDKILKSSRYKKAFDKLEMKWFPIHWKIFFTLCKLKLSLFLVFLLNIMEFLRTRVK